MATVTFDNVNKVYGDFHAVKDLNLEIGDGEFMVLVGPSGCGKTTSAADDGRAGGDHRRGHFSIGDRVVNDVPPKDRDIAMVFQSYALYPHMSVYENMAFGLKLRKMPKAEIDQRVKEAAETLESTPARPQAQGSSPVASASASRSVGRSCASRRSFLMDEPLSNLDAKLRVQTRAEIARAASAPQDHRRSMSPTIRSRP